MSDLVAQIRTAIGDPGSVVYRKGDETVTQWAARAVLVRIDTIRLRAEAFDDAAKAMGEVWGDDHGAGEGLDADIHLLAEQRDRAHRRLTRLRDAVEHVAAVNDSAALVSAGALEPTGATVYAATARELWTTLADVEAGAETPARPECTALCRDVEEDRDRLAGEVERLSADYWREREQNSALQTWVAGIAAHLAAAKADTANGLARWCSWPDCLRSYSATPGPTEPGWTRDNHTSILRCPEHAGAGHRLTYETYPDPNPAATLAAVRAMCDCGEGEELGNATLGEVKAWWLRHVAALAAAPHVEVGGRTAGQVLGEGGGAES